MNSFSKLKFALGIIASTFFIGACGDDGDSVSMTPLAPGERCAEGGFQIDVNGEVQTICNAEKPSPVMGDSISITPLAPGELCVEGGFQFDLNGEVQTICNAEFPSKLESVAKGEAGNPCPTNAVRITTKADGEDLVSWICERIPTDTLPAGARVLLDYFDDYSKYQRLNTGWNTLCSLESGQEVPDLPSEEEIEEFNRVSEDIELAFNSSAACAYDLLVYLPDLSEAATTALQCHLFNYERICSSSLYDRDRLLTCDPTLRDDQVTCRDEQTGWWYSNCRDPEEGLTDSELLRLQLTKDAIERVFESCPDMTR